MPFRSIKESVGVGQRRANGCKSVKGKLLLAKDQYGNTAWHRAAQRGNLETLETLWIWAKEKEIDTDEWKANLFLDQDKQGGPPGTWQPIEIILEY